MKDRMTRRSFLRTAGAGAGVAATASPWALSWIIETGHLSPLTADMVTRFGGISPPDETPVYSGGRVSVHIPYDEDAKDALEDWVDADSDRTLISWNEPINTAAVVVPRSDVISRWGTPDLADVSWRDGAIDLNLRMSIPEPVGLEDDGVWSLLSRRENMLLSIERSSAPVSDGVAFDDDAEAGSIEDARIATGAGPTEEFWDSRDTSDITVAVVDTGFNTSLGDILGPEWDERLLAASKDFTTGDEDDTVEEEGASAVEDGNGHGSHVGSTIVADPISDDYSEYQGYLPESDVLVLRALDDEGSGSTANISRAITYAADEGADLLCLSLGSPLWSVELERALAYAVGEGALPFVAAGNDRMGTTFVNTPGDAAYAMSVGAGTIDDPDDAKTAYFSNVGPDPGTINNSGGETSGQTVDFAAPGMELTALVADTSGSLDEVTLSGTSMATPCVVGCAGLVLSETSVEQDFDDLRDRMVDYASPTPNIGVYEAGAGYPNVQAAIDEAEPDETQEDARTDDAIARDEGWTALSDLHGSGLTQFFL